MLKGELKEKFLRLRRELISLDFSMLNDMQKKAALATEGPLLVLAGAGSGKTTVLIQRIANIIKYGRASDSDDIPDYITEDDVSFLEGYLAAPNGDEREAVEKLCELYPAAPWNVIAITFTNKAAGELKARLTERLGSGANDVWASTFHSACVKILRRDISRLGYSGGFTIYDTQDSERMMKGILSDLNIDDKAITPKTVLRSISRAKDRMIWPEEYITAFPDESDYYAGKVAKAYAEYVKRMRAANAVDFDDIILLAVTILLGHDDVREYYQKKFKYVLIDEYQDTNNLQYLLAKLLAGGWQNICVVGDDDQSIYRFRGATIENILSFESQYKRTRVIKLEQNYRSTGNILTAANGVIENNMGRKGKALWTDNGSGEMVTVYNAYDENDEAAFITRTVLEGVAAGGRFKDYAVLYRMNAQMNRIEEAFKRGGVPYRVIGGTRFFDRQEIKDVLAYMCLVDNPSDNLRLERIINVPARGLGQKTVETVAYFAASLEKPMFDITASASEYEPLLRSASKLHAFADLILLLRELAAALPLDEFYDELLSKTGYLKMWEDKEATEPEVRTRIENILELKSNIVNYMEGAEEPSLGGFLEEVSLFTDIERYDNDADAVVMMTIHSAKGLEFPGVFLAGVEEGLFPGYRSSGFPEELEEERRLCYVGITRARQSLYILHARQRMLFGKTSYNQPSRFIGEIPENCARTRVSELIPQVRESRVRMDPGRTEPIRPRGGLSISPAASAGPKLSLSKGDMIRHAAFGEGMVLSVKQMGGDALLEVAFEAVGTKRLMQKSAAKFITKL
ncbi:MAG: UvrD-helicase domain-containing protein [Oscillospiraceae bacterium]|jgi:DNA helicase-2/ATP-dependent DNA helicase PcrA|nr:UvrD-helicase domain-containing protein [Oscillospiraceae bacterium]